MTKGTNVASVQHRVPRNRRDAARACPERELGLQAAKLLALLSPPVVGVATLAAGAPGALGAVVGLALVFVLFAVSGLLVAAVSRRGPGVALGVAGSAAFVRLALYVVVLSALEVVHGLHRPSLAAATAVALVATLAYEIRVISRTPHLSWVQAS
jgi:ATP synthase protein I